MEHARLVDLLGAVDERLVERGHSIVVGVSGYCGSGKSTLARSLVRTITGAVRIRGDDFLDPERSHRRSTDWDGVERARLVETVLRPHREGVPSRFRRFDWSTRSLAPSEPLPQARVLVVDLIGLFHPESLPDIDLTIWCDVDVDTAAERGMARDARLGRQHEALWREVWIPNERDFDQRFAPSEHAEVRWNTTDSAGCSRAEERGQRA